MAPIAISLPSPHALVRPFTSDAQAHPASSVTDGARPCSGTLLQGAPSHRGRENPEPQTVTPHRYENREIPALGSSSSCKRELAAQRDGLAAARPSWVQREPTRPAGVTGKRWAVVHTSVRAGV
jgi:hypothetical protein